MNIKNNDNMGEEGNNFLIIVIISNANHTFMMISDVRAMK